MHVRKQIVISDNNNILKIKKYLKFKYVQVKKVVLTSSCAAVNREFDPFLIRREYSNKFPF